MDLQKAGLTGAWLDALRSESTEPYFQSLAAFVRDERRQNQIFPPQPAVFRALIETPLDQARVVILGQDPYHGPNQADGLCFSVRAGIKPPPSLLNIFKEIQADPDLDAVIDPGCGSLLAWAKQGVLLLNSVLTVRAAAAGSHAGKGWEQFTDRIIDRLNQRPKPLAFMLWGRYAAQKGERIDGDRHLVLRSIHPSPMAAASATADNQFLGNRHFSRANAWLQTQGEPPIDWSVRAES